eukprot:CAMPEP_0113473284 /NCGR_PEP_ID=MMETSP0014_2-20120614/17966_1 /TAXON_ID=2857 /ORGANISM="Nitzschia sp." /LENGTH=698 /DNA_ID=CAMNT_0000366049 /DNA_START=169 /DNA_END=2265 /DNA_ORIENTATION=- /assembly_acc=CAM_ASM_000159
MTVWSLRSYCEKQFQPNQQQYDHGGADDSLFDSSAIDFLERLGLPSVHPFCTDPEFLDPETGVVNDDAFNMEGIPPMGALDPNDFETIVHAQESVGAKLYTIWCRTAPVLLAMTELWLRLFAAIIAPVGIMYLLHQSIDNLVLSSKSTTLISVSTKSTTATTSTTTAKSSKSRSSMFSFSASTRLSLIMILTTASSLVTMTDTLYVMEWGHMYGLSLFAASVVLSMILCFRHNLPTTSLIVLGLVLLTIHLVWDVEQNTFVFGQKDEIASSTIEEGLYYNNANPWIAAIVANWPETFRTYTKNNASELGSATPWMPTGDSRTGLPFILNHLPNLNWHRVFLQVEYNFPPEYIALDISFPTDDSSTPIDDSDNNNNNFYYYDSTKPVYMILHGLNGGSSEEYVRDFTHRQNAEGATVIVMVARGLMDLPVRGWNNFHGARTSDAHEASWAIRRAVDAVDSSTTLVGVGYSMGAIILSNYVASYGNDCPLDGAITFSGGLDMRYQEDFPRAQRLWQPMLAETLRDDFMLGKWGRRVLTALPLDHFHKMIRATHITEIDRYAVVSYNNFDDLDHYYRSMSALGDIPHENIGDEEGGGTLPIDNNGKIHSVSIPMVVVHSFDDPLISWRTTAATDGFMHPNNLVESGQGNLMLLLTNKGGHVGWPTGFLPFVENWKWMSGVAGSFGDAVDETKKQRRQEEEQ